MVREQGVADVFPAVKPTLWAGRRIDQENGQTQLPGSVQLGRALAAAVLGHQRLTAQGLQQLDFCVELDFNILCVLIQPSLFLLEPNEVFFLDFGGKILEKYFKLTC